MAGHMKTSVFRTYGCTPWRQDRTGPVVDAMYDTGKRFRTMRQRRLARVLYDEGHRSVDALHRGFVEAGMEPFDGPGGFTIERGGDGLLYFYGYEADGSIRIESIGRASGPK